MGLCCLPCLHSHSSFPPLSCVAGPVKSRSLTSGFTLQKALMKCPFSISSPRLNAVREVCVRCPLAMSEELLRDLTGYKTYKDKSVMMAARSLIHLYRETNPTMLHRRDRVSECGHGWVWLCAEMPCCWDMLNGCGFYGGCGPACYDVHKINIIRIVLLINISSFLNLSEQVMVNWIWSLSL